MVDETHDIQVTGARYAELQAKVGHANGAVKEGRVFVVKKLNGLVVDNFSVEHINRLLPEAWVSFEEALMTWETVPAPYQLKEEGYSWRIFDWEKDEYITPNFTFKDEAKKRILSLLSE